MRKDIKTTNKKNIPNFIHRYVTKKCACCGKEFKTKVCCFIPK